MKKILIFVALFMSLILLAADVNISGIWVGETEVPDSPEPDRITLVLKKENSGYVGTITDSLGLAKEAECTDIDLDGDKLTMSFNVVNPEGINAQIYITLTVDGDRMKGYWESDDGDSNALELSRK